MFWSATGGYTTDLSKAEKFTREKAVGQYNSRETDIPVRCDLADAHSYLAVDMQMLPDQPDEPSSDDLRYLVVENRYDGNNVLFLSGNQNQSYDLDAIQPVTKEIAFMSMQADSRVRCYLKGSIEAIARPVVKAGFIPTRFVLSKAKIKMVKVRRQRQSTGKTRHNCPACAKFVWDYSPYDAPFCKMCR